MFKIELIDLLIVKPEPPPTPKPKPIPKVIIPEPEPEPKTNDKEYSNTAAIIIASIFGAGIFLLVIIYFTNLCTQHVTPPRETNQSWVKTSDKIPSILLRRGRGTGHKGRIS